MTLAKKDGAEYKNPLKTRGLSWEVHKKIDGRNYFRQQRLTAQTNWIEMGLDNNDNNKHEMLKNWKQTLE